MKVTVEEDPITELARLLEIDLLIIMMMLMTMMMMMMMMMMMIVMIIINMTITSREHHQPDSASNTSCRQRSSSLPLQRGAESVSLYVYSFLKGIFRCASISRLYPCQ